VADILCFYRDRYFVWSTVTDAPSTYGMTERECVEWFSFNNNIRGFGHAAGLMALARKSGTTSSLLSLDDIDYWNRAGHSETRLSLDEIYRIYCEERRLPTATEGV